MDKLLFRVALFVGKCIYALIKIIPGVSGTTWPGGIACILKKNFVSCFTFNDTTRIVMVTGTSGKTTTTGMLAQLIESQGKTICTNAVGANMQRGVATAFIRSARLSGRVDCDYVILECDERYLPIIRQQVKPDVILVTNILKDQSQRNGEPGVIMKKIAAAIDEDTELILNNDEPNCASFGYGRRKVHYYGVKGSEIEYSSLSPVTVACSCPVCSSAIEYETENLLNIGKFHCTSCELASQEEAVIVEKVAERTIAQGDASYDVKYTSADFLYCYASMLAFARLEGFGREGIQRSINEFKIQSGRVEKLHVKNKTINYLRIKQETPVTLQSAINVTAADTKKKLVVLDLSEVVDFTPNYTGVYYAYDCDFSKLVAGDVERYICMSKTVAYDEATRLLLEGASSEQITVLPTNDYDVLLEELEKYESENVYLLTWMHSYYDCLASVKKYNK